MIDTTKPNRNIKMNMQVVLVCFVLCLTNQVLGLPPNYEDVEDAQDQPENAKGWNGILFFKDQQSW